MGRLSEYNNNYRTSSTIDKGIIQQIKETFKANCINLIIEGYNKYLNDNEKLFTIDEPTITAGLYNHIENQIYLTDIPCAIIPEYTDAIRKGRIKPKKAKKYDLCFIHFQLKPSIYLGVEAKLLVEDNYKNKNAKILVAEYIEDKGMGKYINNIYEKEGLMLGYVIQGKSSNIVEKINLKITEAYTLNDILKHTNKFNKTEPYICISNHDRTKKLLIHIFLNFEQLCN
jgi:hypothetical protein